jgi:hypothetical protein
MSDQLVFLCGARDFHAMDWYKSAKEILPEKDIYILTDLIEGEGYKNLLIENDLVFKLIIIDRFLFKTQSSFGHIWRNFLKLLIFPFQVILIKKFSIKYPNAIYHAHSMYYLFLAWASGIPYVGTPQGSDILIKPNKSKLYKHFTVKALKSAKAITVDSVKMKDKIYELAGLDAQIVQNGIDIDAINKFLSTYTLESMSRQTVLSIRGFTPLYRIREIIMARNISSTTSNIPLTFVYPFQENDYSKEIIPLIKPIDTNMGRLDRIKLYEILVSSKLVISIPYSDSSPRSVYEAIFCGCAVAITYHPFYDYLPKCMKSRIILVDLNDKDWFEKTIKKSSEIIEVPYTASEEALNLFDQKRSFRLMAELLFKN